MYVKSYLSGWIYSYVFHIGETGSLGPSQVWRTVVPALLETPCHVHTGFSAFPNCIMVYERMAIYEVDTERLVDDAGIR